MTFTRCDVCRTEYPIPTDANAITTITLRFNLLTLATATPNFVQLELDVCKGRECVRKAIDQVTRTAYEKALALAGLPTEMLVATRKA